MINIPNPYGIHKGESTHTQDQSIRLVSFKIMKIINITVISPSPPALLEFSI